MKKITVILLCILSLAFICFSVGCSSNVQKFELDYCSQDGVVESVEYMRIEFNGDNYTYKLETKNKMIDAVMKQTGKYIIYKDGHVEITCNENPSITYFTFPGENAYFSGNFFIIESSYLGQDYKMVFSKR